MNPHIPSTKYCPCGQCQCARETYEAENQADLAGTIRHRANMKKLDDGIEAVRVLSTVDSAQVRSIMEAAEYYGDVMMVQALERYLDCVNTCRTYIETAERMKANAYRAYLDRHPELMPREEQE